MTARSVAYWFMDDGSVKSRESKGVVFNTQGFVLNDVERLCDALRSRFGLEAEPRMQKEGFQIYVSGTSFERFREIVDPFVIASMRYTIPSDRKTRMPKL